MNTNFRHRFEKKYYPNTETGCWEWVAAKTKAGYASFKAEGARGYGHIFSYLIYNGGIPDGYEIDHLCRNRACVCPDHLEAVPHAVNVSRGDGGIHQRSRTHCPSGHPYDEANTIWFRDMRYCLACRRRHGRNFMRRKRAAAREKAIEALGK